MDVNSATVKANGAMSKGVAVLLSAAAAIAYPFVLAAFHAVVVSPGFDDALLSRVGAALLLLLAFALPLSGLAVAYALIRSPAPHAAAGRFAYASLAAPPLFVFLGVTRSLLKIHVPELALWIIFWTLAAIWVSFARTVSMPARPARLPARWRVAHGISAALISCYVLFHLTNHLFGLAGPDIHAAIMKAGRLVYRSAFVEPVLVILLLFQVASGMRLAWTWSSVRGDAYRLFQVGSGAYLAAFILTHMNSALISARVMHKIDTNWAWASGAPVGLIHDAWNIRLLPHYALGVFFVLGHLASGLRVVLLAHDVRAVIADRIWVAGLLGGAVVSAAITCALCGVRVSL
jgi:hypothetical protein